MDVLTWLDAQGIPYQILQYPAAITTARDAAAFLGIKERQMLKSLLVKVGEEFVMILTPLDQRLDMEMLKRCFAVSKARMATPDEVLEVTGYKVGTTCPFLLKTAVRIFVLPEVLSFERIAISAGLSSKEILISVESLKFVTQCTALEQS